MSDTIKLAENKFKLVPEGEEIVLLITSAAAKPKANPTVCEVNFKHEPSGATIKNKYDLKKDGGLVAFSILARCILGSDIETFSISKDLPKFVDKRILCEVEHTEYNGNTYANIKKTKKVVTEEVAGQEEEDEL